MCVLRAKRCADDTGNRRHPTDYLRNIVPGLLCAFHHCTRVDDSYTYPLAPVFSETYLILLDHVVNSTCLAFPSGVSMTSDVHTAPSSSLEHV